MADATLPTAAHDFDFLFGSWRIANARLRTRLANADDWEHFEARTTCRPVLGGLGDIDDFRSVAPGWEGFQGGTLRLYNHATGQWRLHWMDNLRGELFPPLIGGFADGRGEFFGDDQHEGRPVRVRFRWRGDGPDAAHWEQAFSADGGATWETNWTMDFTRVPGDEE